jgi:hypothetical protein
MGGGLKADKGSAACVSSGFFWQLMAKKGMIRKKRVIISDKIAKLSFLKRPLGIAQGNRILG